MAKFKLSGPWPCSAVCLDAGTILDANSPEWKGKLFPPEALPIDAEAIALYARWYPSGTRCPGT